MRGGGMNMDPGARFDQMANGKAVIVISEVTDQRAQWWLNMIAQRAGITNGQITREQYVSASQQMMAQFRGGRGVPQRGNDPASAQAPPPPTQQQMDQWDQAAEAEFKRRDTNNDGKLNQDEMGGRLRRELDRWDANKDGVIDLTEFKAYFRDQMQQQQQAQWAANQPAASPLDDLDKHPTVFRAGKLPKELPPWFKQLDANEDGQIGLYEWTKSGRPIEEFLAMDRNQDGFLTIEEVLRAEKKKKGTTKQGTGQPSVAQPQGGAQQQQSGFRMDRPQNGGARQFMRPRGQ
jgi:Ca2+-binding EF-hand superfamily protein